MSLMKKAIFAPKELKDPKFIDGFRYINPYPMVSSSSKLLGYHNLLDFPVAKHEREDNAAEQRQEIAGGNGQLLSQREQADTGDTDNRREKLPAGRAAAQQNPA